MIGTLISSIWFWTFAFGQPTEGDWLRLLELMPSPDVLRPGSLFAPEQAEWLSPTDKRLRTPEQAAKVAKLFDRIDDAALTTLAEHAEAKWFQNAPHGETPEQFSGRRARVVDESLKLFVLYRYLFQVPDDQYNPWTSDPDRPYDLRRVARPGHFNANRRYLYPLAELEGIRNLYQRRRR